VTRHADSERRRAAPCRAQLPGPLAVTEWPVPGCPGRANLNRRAVSGQVSGAVTARTDGDSAPSLLCDEQSPQAVQVRTGTRQPNRCQCMGGRLEASHTHLRFSRTHWQ
jgi:hypothetical protein